MEFNISETLQACYNPLLADTLSFFMRISGSALWRGLCQHDKSCKVFFCLFIPFDFSDKRKLEYAGILKVSLIEIMASWRYLWNRMGGCTSASKVSCDGSSMRVFQNNFKGWKWPLVSLTTPAHSLLWSTSALWASWWGRFWWIVLILPTDRFESRTKCCFKIWNDLKMGNGVW